MEVDQARLGAGAGPRAHAAARSSSSARPMSRSIRARPALRLLLREAEGAFGTYFRRQVILTYTSLPPRLRTIDRS